MTDEEKAIDLTSKSFELEKDKVEWFCNKYKNTRMSEIHTFYNGVLYGLAEGRKESAEEIERLKTLNVKLRCCDNCKHVKYDWDDQLRIGKCKTCISYSNWEIRK